MGTCLIIIDSLRYDHAPPRLRPRPCRSLADTTEPSIATILSGLPPWEHGILKTGQRGAGKLLDRIRNRLLPSLYDSSLIASPAIIFHKYFTYSYTMNRIEDEARVAKTHLGEVDFILLHDMTVHDLAVGEDEAMRYYEGYEPLPRYARTWRPPSGLKRPYQHIFDKGDLGLLKAYYKAAVDRVFRVVENLLRDLDGWRVIITSDHGESLIYWHHDGVPDDVYRVPLIANFELEDREYTHLDVYRLCLPNVGR